MGPDVQILDHVVCRAIELEPRFARAHYNRGLGYRARGHFDQAIADFTRAVEFDPELTLAYYNRGEAHESSVRVRCAIGTRRVGENPPPCVLTGAFDRALSDYSKAIELDPRNAAAYFLRSGAYWAKGDYDQSIADVTRAIELHPKSALSYNGRGSAYHMKGLYDLAIADYSKAIEVDPKSALSYANRGEAYEDWGRVEQAAVDYRTALTLAAEKEVHHAAQSGLDRIARGPSATRPTPDPVPPKTAVSGTGILVSNDGAVLTNAHVVPNCAAIRINRVGLASVVARMVAADRTHDLALLKTETVGTSAVRPAPFRNAVRSWPGASAGSRLALSRVERINERLPQPLRTEPKPQGARCWHRFCQL